IFLLLSSFRSHHDLPLLSLTAKSWATSYSKLTEANTAGPLTIGLARSQTAPVNKRANRPPAARSSAWARSANHSDRRTKHHQCSERTGDGRHARSARRPTLVLWWEGIGPACSLTAYRVPLLLEEWALREHRARALRCAQALHGRPAKSCDVRGIPTTMQ